MVAKHSKTNHHPQCLFQCPTSVVRTILIIKLANHWKYTNSGRTCVISIRKNHVVDPPQPHSNLTLSCYMLEQRPWWMHKWQTDLRLFAVKLGDGWEMERIKLKLLNLRNIWPQVTRRSPSSSPTIWQNLLGCRSPSAAVGDPLANDVEWVYFSSLNLILVILNII